tara:strand:- start:37 stop:246 length:210 start_codon:yes stop_codon:yes gene_type:complete
MVRIEEMEDNIEDFFNDSDRFKKMRMLIDFEMPEFKTENPNMEFSKPKLKKGQKAAKFIKPDRNKKSLF